MDKSTSEPRGGVLTVLATVYTQGVLPFPVPPRPADALDFPRRAVMLKGSPGPTLHTRRQPAPLAPGGLSPEPALRVPMDAPACPVAAHRPPDALYLSIGQVGLELSIERSRPGQQAVVRAAQRQLAECQEQLDVAPLGRGRRPGNAPALRDRRRQVIERVRLGIVSTFQCSPKYRRRISAR